jgi:stage III sporulation protein AB
MAIADQVVVALKLAGAGLAVGCSWMAGVEHARWQRRCADELGRWITALSALETEVSYSQNRLADALERASGVAGGCAGRRLQRAAELLAGGGGTPAECIRQALEEVTGPLDAEKLGAVVVLSDCLGASHSSDQVRQIRLAAARLERAMREAEAKADRYARLWPSLGFLIGAMVVLAFL